MPAPGLMAAQARNPGQPPFPRLLPSSAGSCRLGAWQVGTKLGGRSHNYLSFGWTFKGGSSLKTARHGRFRSAHHSPKMPGRSTRRCCQDRTSFVEWGEEWTMGAEEGRGDMERESFWTGEHSLDRYWTGECCLHVQYGVWLCWCSSRAVPSISR